MKVTAYNTNSGVGLIREYCDRVVLVEHAEDAEPHNEITADGIGNRSVFIMTRNVCMLVIEPDKPLA